MRSYMSLCTRLAALVLLMSAQTTVRAQAPDLLVKFDRVLKTVDVDARRADVRDVVSELFSQAGAPRVDMNPDVRGRVTLHLKAVTRESALAAALQQANAFYRVEKGVYVIRANGSSRDDDRRDRDRDRDPRRDRGDPDRPIRLEDAPEAFRKRVDMVAEDRPIGEIVRSLGRTANVNIAIDRNIPGDLTLDVLAKSEPLWNVLQRMAAAAHLKLDVLGPTDVVLRPLPSFYAYYRGRRIGGSTGATFSCRYCRFNELKPGWRFCPMCGQRIER